MFFNDVVFDMIELFHDGQLLINIVLKYFEVGESFTEIAPKMGF